MVIVILAPARDDAAGIGQAENPVFVQTLIPEAAVEVLTECILTSRPIKRAQELLRIGDGWEAIDISSEYVDSGFGEPVDVVPPAEALGHEG